MPPHFVHRFSAFILLAGHVSSQVTSLPPAVLPSAFASTSILPACPVDYFQCPSSLGYGCCLTGYACGTSDCFLEDGPQTGPTPSSAASSSSLAECAGRRGYLSCAQSLGGDCCPNGYICDTATGVPCRLTLRLNQVTETVTVTGLGFTEIRTTMGIVGPTLTAVDRVPEAIARETTTSNSDPGAAQQTDTTNLDSGTSSNDSSGLTSQQIGGIVGGVLGAALLLLAGSAFLVLRHRRRRRRQREAAGADGPENPFEKKELDGQGWQRAELPSQTAAAEMAGSHPEFELPGDFERHGRSELDGTPRS